MTTKLSDLGSSLLLACSLLVLGCGDDTHPAGTDSGSPPTPLDKAVAAVGGEAGLVELSTFRIAAEGTRYFPGEQYRPTDPAPTANRYRSALSYDLAHDQLRVDTSRDVVFLREISHTFSEIVRGDLASATGTDGLFGSPAGDLLAAGTAALRRDARLMNPTLLLREAVLEPSRVSSGGTADLDGERHELLVLADDVAPLTLWVNARTGRIAKLATLTSDPLERDVPVEVVYGGTWQLDRFPDRVDYYIDGERLLSEQRSQAEANGAFDASLFDFPATAKPVADPDSARFGRLHHVFHQNFASIGLRLDAIQAFVNPTELAPGVYMLAGGSHNSLAVEQADGIVLVEAPLYGARSRAITAWASTQFPGKPIRHVVATHFHDDHSGGVREIAAGGATVVAHAESEALYRQVFAAPSKLEPDSLTGPASAVPYLGVRAGSPLTLADAKRPVTIHAIPNVHAYDMVIVHLPQQDIVFESDLFSPGFPPGFEVPWAVNLRDAMIALGMTGAKIVGGHGGTATFADLEAFIQP